MSDPGDSPDERLPHLEPDSDPDRDDLSYVQPEWRTAARNQRTGSLTSSIQSSTISVRDSIFQFIQENGRTYHSFSAGSYFLPNDLPELERLDIQYHVIHNVLGRRQHLAPLQNPRQILDIGTGTGIWAIEMAMKFPNARVIGTDLSPTQKEKPVSNVEWMAEDANDKDWGKKRYDYIHTRMMMGAFEDFREIIQRSYDYLQPGGWMESQEAYPTVLCDDGTLDKETNAFYLYSKKLDEAAMTAGKPIRIANKLKRWFQEVGFVDVQEEVFKIPINSWPKDPQFKLIGRFWADSLMAGLQGFALALFTRYWGWTVEEVEVYLVDVRRAMQDRSVHAYHKFYVVWGRKPTVEEMQARKAAQATPSEQTS